MTARCAEDASRALDFVICSYGRDDAGDALRRLNQMRELWDRTPDAFASVKAVMRTLDDMAPEYPQRAPDAWGAVFDRAVEASSEASVALYCLGRTDPLHAATVEILRWMQSRELLTPRACVLDGAAAAGASWRPLPSMSEPPLG
ncbi:hypothetical protein [Bradyrhizobium retamae]|nr:hypothetical protein [Bradyrhizobium retamae]